MKALNAFIGSQTNQTSETTNIATMYIQPSVGIGDFFWEMTYHP
jgi:hypothetical protein